jgi:Holliday junction resolvasome RuvABC ATP-dependent DNA helicase subunit
MKGYVILTPDGWEEMKAIFGIYSRGLNAQEIELMQILAVNAPMSCQNIAIRMGLNERNVDEDLELRLREIGFIQNTPKGRMLTNEAKTYLARA